MNKKRWMVLLLLLAVVVGIFLLKQRGTGKEPSTEDTVPEVASVEDEEEGNAEEFYYTEELVWEGEDWRKLVILFDEECMVRFEKGEDGQQYLKGFRIKDGKEFFSYPEEGEIVGQIVAYSDVLYFLEYRENGEMMMVALDGTGKKNREVPIRKRNWVVYSGEQAEWKHFAQAYGADEDYFYIISDEYETKQRALEIYRWDGTLFSERKLRQAENFFADNKGNYYIYETGMLSKTRTSDGEKLYEEKVRKSWGRFWLDKNFETIYIVDLKGTLISYDLSNGREKGAEMIFGKDTSYFLEGNRWLIAGVSNGEKIYVHTVLYSSSSEDVEEGTVFIYKYTKVYGKRPQRTNILTVTVPYETEALRQAKIRYEMKEKDTEVRFESKYNNVNGFLSNREQYQEQMRMKMSTGDFGDIVEIGQTVDFLTMAKADVFLDLKPYLEKSAIREKLNAKILRAYERNGTMRGIPTEYIVHYYQFNRETAKRIGWTKDPEEWKWSDLLSLAKKLEEEGSTEYLFSDPGNYPYRLINIVRANMSDLADYEKKTVNLHEEWFMNLMKQLKEVNKSRNIAYDVMNRPVRNPAWDGDFMGDGMLYQEWQMSKLYSKLGDEIETAQNRDVILVKNIRGEKHPNRLAYPQQVFSISSNSRQKDRAFRFLETLLDFGAQQWCDGLPMNAEAMDRQWRLTGSKGLKKEVVHEYEKMHRAIIEDIDSVYANEYVNAAVIKQLQDYLDDKLSLEEALTKAEHDVMIILNE